LDLFNFQFFQKLKILFIILVNMIMEALIRQQSPLLLTEDYQEQYSRTPEEIKKVWLIRALKTWNGWEKVLSQQNCPLSKENLTSVPWEIVLPTLKAFTMENASKEIEEIEDYESSEEDEPLSEEQSQSELISATSWACIQFALKLFPKQSKIIENITKNLILGRHASKTGNFSNQVFFGCNGKCPTCERRYLSCSLIQDLKLI
jgi:hypothetical protein